MTSDQRERAFDRFWRAPGADQEGSGLGLAIVRQLLDASGGVAELRPNPDGGLDAVARLRPADHTATRTWRRPHPGPPTIGCNLIDPTREYGRAPPASAVARRAG
jgi:Histidine kinase-, DNA gyrase B-, and HSP90-like ATPase